LRLALSASLTANSPNGFNATAFTLSLSSSSGANGAPVTVTVTPNGAIPVGGASVTLAASNDGTLGVTSLSFTSGSTAAQTTTLTRATAGSSTVTMTNNIAIPNTGSPASFTSEAAYVPSSAYRSGQTYLFQPVPAPMPSTLGGDSYDFEGETSSLWGPSRTHVSASGYSGWEWTNAGGDWIDAAAVRMGTTHWATQGLSAVGGTPVSHTLSITAALQYIQTQNRWNAWIVGRVAGTSYRYMGGRVNANAAYRPRIDVTYTDASTATLACRVSSRLNSGTPNQRQTEIILATSAGTGEVALEFERPTKAVASATLHLTITQDGGGTGSLWANIADPPMNTEPVTGTAGLASIYGPLDADLATDPNIIGVQRYVDGVTLSDFFAPLNAFNYNAEVSYDPGIYGYGGGVTDLAKLPHAHAGKWIDSNQDANLVSIVSSSYTAEGFEPLHPGLGAVRAEMPNTGVLTGDEQANGGNTAVARKLMMPPSEYGLLDRIFVRYYFRLGTPYAPLTSDIKEILRFGNPEWTAMGGKWGIAPEHVTSYGGFSGSSGGQKGWQLRHKWVDGEADLSTSPPDGGALHSGWHLYDFNLNNPVGYRYQAEPVSEEAWGQKGGHGATFYPGRWYLIEQEVKLNSVDAPSGTGDGLDWTPDGELRVWVDGRLAFERTGMVFRALPLHSVAYNSNALRPIREIGVKALLWNFYHGGLNDSTYQRAHFVTGLAWGKQRIGPMKAPIGYSVPSGQITNITATNTRADVSPQLDPAANPNFPSSPPYFNGRGWSTVTDYAGAVFATDVGANGTYMQYAGAGHVAVNALFWIGFDVTDRTWKRIGDRPPQTNGLVGLTFPGGLPDWAAMYALGGVYAAFNNTYGDWNGDHASMPEAFRLPGKTTIPAGSHSRNRMAYRPASAAGNTQGQIVVGWHVNEVWDYTGVGTAHTWDGDTATWSRHANQRASHEAKAGGFIYHAAHDVIVGPNQNSGPAVSMAVFNCASQTWTQRTITSGGRLHVSDATAFGWTDGSGNVWHICVAPANSLAPAQTFFAVRVDQLISGTGMAWVDLTVAATTWPATSLSGSGIPSFAYTVSWAHCPVDGCYYATNRQHGSNKLWKLTPPVSGVLTDTWTITETTLGGTTLSALGANGVDQISWDYGRMCWVPALSAFLWIGNRLDAPVQAIRPIGV